MKIWRTLFAVVLVISVVVCNAFAQDRIIRNKVYFNTINQSVNYILITPPNCDYSRKYPLFIFMHSLGYSPDYVLNSDYSLLTKQDFYILIPQAPIKYNNGFSWYNLKDNNQFIKDLEKSEYVITGLTQYISKYYNIDSSQVVLSGFSQGGRLCFYIGFKNPNLFSEIIPIGGYYMDKILDPYIGGVKNLKVSIFHGSQDNVNPFNSIKNAYEKLKAKNINVSLNSYPLQHTYTTKTLETVLKHVPK